MRTQWVIGNWKMNGSLSDNAVLLNELVAELGQKSADACGSSAAGCGCRTESDESVQCLARFGVAVPSVYLAQAHRALGATAIAVGAQNVSDKSSGAYTGEISAAMLQEFGVSLVLIGHSERRSLYGETDAQVADKALAVLASGMTPVVCVGETQEQRESGQAQAVVVAQLNAVAEKVQAVMGVSGLARMIVAYEPVWAIGTGKTASPEQAQEVHQWLRAAVAERDAQVAAELTIVYGGSVKAANAREIFAMPDVDGGLIGGASLVAQEFLAICAAAQACA